MYIMYVHVYRVQVGVMSDYLDTASVKQLHFIDPIKAGKTLHIHHIHCHLPPSPHNITTLPSSPHFTIGSLLDIPQIDSKMSRSSMLGKVGRKSFLKVIHLLCMDCGHVICPDSIPQVSSPRLDSIKNSRRMTPPSKQLFTNLSTCKSFSS